MSFLIYCAFACILGRVNSLMGSPICNDLGCSGPPPGTTFLTNDAQTIFLTDDAGASQLYSG